MTELNIDLEHKLQITPKALNGVRIAVLGIPGSGKSNTIAVLLEENVPYNTGITILDMHDEYWGLKQKFPFLRVGKNQPLREGAERRSPPVDLELNAANAADFAEEVFLKRIPVIVNLRWMSKDERQDLVLKYTQRLYELNMSYGRPYWVVLEEAHTFIPEGRKTPELEKLNEFAAEGRKLGFTIILGSQRAAKIDKDVLSSCDMFFLHRVSIELDVRSYRGLLPTEINRHKDLFITMPPGQAVVKWLKGGLPQFDIVQIRPQSTFHVGATPDAMEEKLPVLQTVDMSTLGDLGLNKSHKPAPIVAAPDKQLLAERDKALAEVQARYRRLQRVHMNTLAAWLAAKLPTDEVLQPTLTLPHTPLAGELANPILITDAGIAKQQRSFNALLKDVVNGCKHPFHITILKYLIEREETVMTLKDIARFVGLSESTVRDHPLLYLCQSPITLLQRGRFDKDLSYWSIARETLGERFPDLPTDELIMKLLEV
jgi:hypothetical protein